MEPSTWSLVHPTLQSQLQKQNWASVTWGVFSDPRMEKWKHSIQISLPNCCRLRSHKCETGMRKRIISKRIHMVILWKDVAILGIRKLPLFFSPVMPFDCSHDGHQLSWHQWEWFLAWKWKYDTADICLRLCRQPYSIPLIQMNWPRRERLRISHYFGCRNIFYMATIFLRCPLHEQ